MAEELDTIAAAAVLDMYPATLATWPPSWQSRRGYGKSVCRTGEGLQRNDEHTRTETAEHDSSANARRGGLLRPADSQGGVGWPRIAHCARYSAPRDTRRRQTVGRSA